MTRRDLHLVKRLFELNLYLNTHFIGSILPLAFQCPTSLQTPFFLNLSILQHIPSLNWSPNGWDSSSLQLVGLGRCPCFSASVENAANSSVEQTIMVAKSRIVSIVCATNLYVKSIAITSNAKAFFAFSICCLVRFPSRISSLGSCSQCLRAHVVLRPSTWSQTPLVQGMLGR